MLFPRYAIVTRPAGVTVPASVPRDAVSPEPTMSSEVAPLLLPDDVDDDPVSVDAEPTTSDDVRNV